MKRNRTAAFILSAVFALLCFVGCRLDNGPESSGDLISDVEETGSIKVIEINLTDEEYAFGVDKAQPELLNAVNDFIKEIKENGKFEEICNHYFGDGTPVAVSYADRDETKDQLVVATNAAFEPFEFMRSGELYGIDMEIAALLAEKLGKELVIVNLDFEDVCPAVGEHSCDIAMAGLTVKPDREEYVAFSSSYYAASQRLVTRSDDATFDRCADASAVEKLLGGFDESVKIGVQIGTTAQFYCEGDPDWGFPGIPVTTVGYQNGFIAMQALANGELDYVIIDSAPANFIAASINKLNS